MSSFDNKIGFWKEEIYFLRGIGKEFRVLIVWDEVMCHEDPDALGCYATFDGQSSVLVNLRKVSQKAITLVPEPETSLIATLVHLSDLCLIHELTHWAGEDDSKHGIWNDFILPRLIFPLCEASVSPKNHFCQLNFWVRCFWSSNSSRLQS